MTTTATIAALPIALNDEGKAPRRIHVLPRGPVIRGRDGREWRLRSPDRLIAAFSANATPIPLDYEHGSALPADGKPRPVAGWIEALEQDDAGVWGLVSWTPRGADMVANREYRFISPAFSFDPGTKEVSRLISAGLVHTPNLHLTALNSQKVTTMDPELARALGLPEAATAADAITAINALKAEKAVALNAAQNPPLERFVPVEQYQQTVVALNSAQAALDDFERAAKMSKAEALIDGAVAAGKITPASRDSYLTLALNSYDAMAAAVGVMPVIVRPGVDPALEKAQKPEGDGKALTESQVALCRQLGISEQDFLSTSI